MAIYKLKKDLPFAKAGTKLDEFVHSTEGNHAFIGIGTYRCQIPEKNVVDWVEEIKPRRFVLLIKDDILQKVEPFRTKNQLINKFCNYDELILVEEIDVSDI